MIRLSHIARTVGLLAISALAAWQNGTLFLAGDSIGKSIGLSESNGRYAIDGIALAKILRVPVSHDAGLRQLRIGNSTWTSQSPWAASKDSAVRLDQNVNEIGGRYWLPLPSSLLPLESATGKALQFDSATRTLRTSLLRDLVAAEVQARDNGEIWELRFSKPVRSEGFLSRPYYIVRFDGITSIDTVLLKNLASASTLATRSTPIQEKKSAQLTLQIKDLVEQAELITRDSGKTIQILLRRKTLTSSSSAKIVSSSSQQAAAKSKIRMIVIDPGHGGKDPGAIGYKGLQEKDVVLAVAKKLATKLKANGYQARLTRDDDVFLELPDRPAMASQWGGDLFISLHCNAVDGAARQKKTEGFKFYILREAESEEDKAIARRENKAIELSASKKGKSDISPVEWILLENQLNLYTKESERFTGYLIDTYDGGKIKKMSTGVGQAGFMVLVGAFMPAVLVEIGFITHPEDAAWMSSPTGQDDIALRLYKAISGYSKATQN